MVSLKDVAKACGVSLATASKALNGYADIKTETAALVRDTANAMGYFPNSVARAMRTNRTNNIGILFTDKTHHGLGHEYFSSMLESFKSEAESRGYDITFISQNIGGRPMSYLEHCRYRHFDGVMIASVDFTDPMVVELANSGIPVVTIDYVFNNCSAIMSNNVKAMKTLTEYIISRGHRKIAFIYGEDTVVTRKRLAGFHEALAEHNIKIPDAYLKTSMYHDPRGSAHVTKELLALRDRPTCIIYPDDFSYIGGLNEIEYHGLKVPTDISVAGFDGIFLSQALRPKLTTLKQDTDLIGRTAAQKLIKAIEAPLTSAPDQVLIEGYLLEGQTIASLEETDS